MGSNRKRSIQLCMVAAALTGAGARSSQATPLVFEDFNPAGTGNDLDQTVAAGAPGSTTGFGLNGTSGGLGFVQGDWYNNNFGYYTKNESGNAGGNGAGKIFRTASSSVTTTVGTTLTTTNFVYPTNSSLPAPAGGAAQATGQGYSNNLYEASLTNPIPLSGTNTTYYFSYLMGDQGNEGSDYQAQLLFDGSNTRIYAGFGYAERSAIDVTDTASGTLPFGNGNSHNAAGGSYGTGFNLGTLALVLGKIDTTVSGADTVSVKIFPFVAGGTASIPVNPANISWDTSLGVQTTDTVTQLGMFIAGTTDPAMDAIRVGTTYADAVGTITPITVAGSFTTYTGAISGAFDTSTKNFKTGSNPSVAFTPGDSVLFDDTATGTHNIVVGTGGVTPSAVTFNNSTAYNISGAPITSPGLLNIIGGGIVTLSNSNTYASSVNLSNGTVVLAAGAKLTTSVFPSGGGTLSFNGGILQAYNNSTSFLTTPGVNVTAAGATIDTQAFNISIGASLLENPTSTGGGLVKIGSGTLTLKGHSTYSGGTNVNAGTLILANGGGSGAVSGPLTINSGTTVMTPSTDAIGYAAGQAVTTLTVNAGGTFVNTSGGNEGYITNLVLNGGSVATTGGGSFNVNGMNIISNANSVVSTISSDVYLRGGTALPTNFNVASGAAGTALGSDLTITGRIFSNGGALIKNGAGILTLSGSNTLNGATNVTAGTLVVASATAVNNPLIVASGANVTIAAHGVNPTLVPVFKSLTSSGTIDIKDNAVDLTTSDFTATSTQVAAAYNNGTWTGNSSNGVITSSIAAANPKRLTAVGVATGFTSFQGGTVGATDVLVKYTYYGDANLDGLVDGTDYSRIDASAVSELSGPSVSGWYNGDFNYDGVVNGSDYTLIDNAFNSQGVTLASGLASPTAEATAEVAGSNSASVPEPTVLTLLGMGAVGLLGRRRRQ